uniref:ABC transporter domain-containing protein n=1 Tax=Plectus sambesii TaxID=2011161 RepID=A0A914WXS9_9BILA
MTSVWTQLRLLLWKNFMIRRRQKKWLTVELLTPVVLFLFLALIRTRDFSDPNPTCHYDAKAMPGTGLLPFLQSLLCGLANTCQSKPTTGDDQGIVGRNMPNDSLLVTTLRDVSKFLSSTGADSEPLQMLARDLVKIVQTLAHLPVSDPAYADPNVPIASFFNKGTNISSVLNDELKNYTAAEMLSTASLTPYFFVTALRELLPSLNNLTAGSGMQLAMQLLPVADEIIKEAFCDADSRRKSVVLVNGGDPPEQLCNFSIFNLAIGIYFGGENPFNASGAIVAVAHALPALTGRNITAATALDLLAISTSLQNELGASNLQALIKDVFDFFASAGNGTSGVLDTLTCGQLNSLRSQVNTGSTTLGGGSNALQEFIEKVMNSSAPSPGPGNGTLGECGSIVIQKDPPGCDRVMFLPQLHSVLLGYILVTPPAPAVKKLVAKLESLLRDINAVRNSLFRFNSDGAAYQDALANSDLSKAMAVVRDMIDHLNKTMGGLPLPPAWQSAITTVEHLFGPANDSRSLFPLIKNPVDMLANFTKCIATNRFVFADNERQLEEMGICLGGQNLYFTGLVFVNVSDDAAEFPLLTTYKIRPANALSDSTMYSRDSASHIAPRDNPIRDLKYLTFGFSFLQDAVERALIEMRTNESVPIGTYAQQTPHPCYNRDRFAELIPGFVPLFIVLSWIIPAALVVKNIVHEKELRLKEVMRVMGLGDAVHWVAWGLQAFVTQFISVILIVGLLKVGSIPRSDASVLFVLLTLFSVSCITQCLLLATFFSRANIATAATTIFYFLARFPYDIGRRRIQGFWPKMISCLMSQSAIGWGFNEVAMWEQRRIGVQWSNIRLSGNEYGGDINLLSILVAFVVEIFIHLLLTWYISAVFPGQYGIAEPWYFFVTRKYWLGPKIARNGPDELERSEKFDSIAQVHPSEDFEAEPVGVRLAVDIRNLKKTYSNGTKAVDGLSVRFYESQITSFLGHNGAGKTTTMSILTGLYPPTSGTAYIYDKDIRTDIQEIRKSLGMCPQHNVLFDTLTVKEQLRFYAGLKGMDASQASTEIDQMIKDIGLSDKGNEFADQLSGGMKRKLSIGIAFIGGSRTVILDEPTAGVDPHARRGIWDLLIKYKQGRTIIMSTHHMDEADVLGDRIAIVAEGRLRAWGSSLFLKTRFGSGYRLTVLKAGGIGASRSNPSLPDLVPPAGSASFLDSSSSKIKHSSGLVDFVTSRVDGSQLVEEFHQEIVFSLPLAFDLDAMQRFFLELDDNLSRFAVASYGISASSLEEIFLTVAPMREDSLKKEHVGCQCLRGLTQHLRLNKGAKNRSDAGELMQDDSGLSESNESLTTTGLNKKETKSSGDEGPAQETKRLKKFAKHPSVRYIESSSALAMHRIKAMQYKRLHNFRRSPKGAFCELVLPVLLILVATISYSLVGQSMGVKQNQPPLLLNPWLYGDSNYPNVIFYSIENNDTNPSGQKYFDALTDWPGLGVKCVPDDPFSDPNDDMVCNGNNTWVDPPSNETFAYNVSQQCGCGSDSLWQCTYNDYWPKPSARWTNTSDILVDMTARNISQWILMSYQEFLFNRYGGFSLGEIDKKAMDERDVQNATVGVDRLTALIDEIGRNLSIVVHVNASFVNDPFDQNRTVSGVLKKALASMTTAENVQV